MSATLLRTLDRTLDQIPHFQGVHFDLTGDPGTSDPPDVAPVTPCGTLGSPDRGCDLTPAPPARLDVTPVSPPAVIGGKARATGRYSPTGRGPVDW